MTKLLDFVGEGNCHIVPGKICATDCVLNIFVQLCWRVKSALLFLYLEYLLQFQRRIQIDASHLNDVIKSNGKKENLGSFFLSLHLEI